jgi:hypothetical protein
MARSGDFTVRMDGMKELRQVIRTTKDKGLRRAITKANRATGAVVADDARSNAPERSGRLARSVKPTSSQREAQVKAGTAKTVPYAGPIHFGWPARGIRAQEFLFAAARRQRPVVEQTYREALEEALRGLSTQ